MTSSIWVTWLLVTMIVAFINGAIAKSRNRSVLAWVLLTIPFGFIATLVVAVVPGLPKDDWTP